jgi:methyl-accepting chemotaxis protein
MTIRSKLLACMAVLAIAISLLVGAFYYSSQASRGALSTVLADRVVPLEDLKHVADTYAVQIVDTAHKARNGNISFAEAGKSVRDGSSVIKARWQTYRATKIVGEEEQLARNAESTMAKADPVVSKLQAVLDRGDRAALDQLVIAELYPAIDPVSDAFTKLAGIQISIAKSDTEQALETASTMFVVMIVLALGSVGTLLGALLVVTKQVVRPIGNLSETIRDLAKKPEAEVPHIDQRDEIGDISRAVDIFRTSVVEKERVRAAEAAAVQERVTTALAEGLSALAAGDLTYSVDIAFPPEFEKLKTDFNAAVRELQEAMSTISRATANIHGGSGEISAASDDLSRRTEQQAASLEETAAAMTEITATVQNSAAGANEANKLVRSTQADAQASSKVVADAVAAMAEIEKSSQEITKIIEVIDKIAFQTNLLALNASVEAAHAGEAGRAFAVVANEVRALAQRSADAAQEIGQLISNSSRQVEGGVTLVGEAGSALGRIIGSVDEVSTLVGQIAMAADQQSSALAQVNTAITEMDKVTQQNAAMVEESNAAAKSLSDEASGLARLVGRFNTGAEAAPPAARRARKAAVPPARGNTALALQSNLATAVGDWNEF